jgi:hypothetical protein
LSDSHGSIVETDTQADPELGRGGLKVHPAPLDTWRAYIWDLQPLGFIIESER